MGIGSRGILNFRYIIKWGYNKDCVLNFYRDYKELFDVIESIVEFNNIIELRVFYFV